MAANRIHTGACAEYTGQLQVTKTCRCVVLTFGVYGMRRTRGLPRRGSLTISDVAGPRTVPGWTLACVREGKRIRQASLVPVQKRSLFTILASAGAGEAHADRSA